MRRSGVQSVFQPYHTVYMEHMVFTGASVKETSAAAYKATVHKCAFLNLAKKVRILHTNIIFKDILNMLKDRLLTN